MVHLALGGVVIFFRRMQIRANSLVHDVCHLASALQINHSHSEELQDNLRLQHKRDEGLIDHLVAYPAS